MTVSNAYNHPDRLSEALRERIFETAGKLGYHGPDPVGRSLRRQRTDVVGVLYSNPLSYAFEDPAAVSFLGGLSSVTEEADLGLLLVPAAGMPSRNCSSWPGPIPTFASRSRPCAPLPTSPIPC